MDAGPNRDVSESKPIKCSEDLSSPQQNNTTKQQQQQASQRSQKPEQMHEPIVRSHMTTYDHRADKLLAVLYHSLLFSFLCLHTVSEPCFE